MTTLTNTTRAAIVLGALGVLPACYEPQGRPGQAWPGAAAAGDTEGDATDGEASPLDLQPLGLDQLFTAAAEEFDVPPEILKAVAWVESRWTMLDPELGGAHDHGAPPRYGVMGLSHTRLDEAAELAGVDTATATTDPTANIRAAAAWLSARADQLGIEDRDNLASWAGAVQEYPGFEHPIAQSGYVYDEIYKTLRRGFVARTLSGEIQGELEPVEVWPAFDVPPPLPALQAGPDYPDAAWRPSPNTSSRPSGAGGRPTLIVIHTCEGSYNGCWSWLTQSQSGVSAHYVVNADGSEVSQLVAESRKAWHISAKYDCSRNGNQYCSLNGAGSNNFTIGIEHAGFGSQASWDEGLLHASAQLVCDITQDQGLSRDEFHIVGHGQLQPYNRSDPGPNWPWDEYLELVDFYCNGAGGPNESPDPEPEPTPEPEPEPEPIPGGFQTIVVDSNNANNAPNRAMMAVSNTWVSANATPGYHGTGYWFADTSANRDPAVFWFYLAEAGSHTIEGWWTAGTNRASNTEFVMVDASGGEVGKQQVDQTTGGSAWRNLGTYSFSAGWNAVQLSRRADPGKVVIADAVRIR